MTEKRKIGVGLIGSGFMGKAHALGFATAARVFDLPLEVDLAVLADVDADLAGRAGLQLGFTSEALARGPGGRLAREDLQRDGTAE